MSSTSTNPNPNPNPNPHNDRTSFSHILLGIVVIFLFAIIAVLAFILFAVVFWIFVFLVASPAIYVVDLIIGPPTTDPAVTLTSLSVSSFNLTADSLSADFDLALAFDNPNRKKSFYYDLLVTTVYLGQAFKNSASNPKTCDRLDATVYFGLNRLAASSLVPLFLPKNTSVTLNARMVAASVFIGEDTAHSIRSGFQKGDANVTFDLLVGAVVRSWHDVRVNCQNVNVEFKNASGAMNNGPIRC